MALNLSTLTSSATSGDVLAEALTTADFLENVPVLRNLSRNSNKGGDAKQDVALNQPKALPLDANGKGYLYLCGVSGNYASVPDPLGSLGDFTMQIDGLNAGAVRPDTLSTLISQYDNSSGFDASFILRINTDGTLNLVLYTTAGSESLTSSAVPANTAGIQVKRVGTIVEYLIDTGSGFNIHDTDTSNGISLSNASCDVQIGVANTVTSRLKGKISRAIIWDNGTQAGDPVLDVDFTATNIRHGDTKFKCATGQVITINQSGNDPATVIKKSVLRFDGVNDGLQGLFANNINSGYMFAAFSVLGDGGDDYGRIFGANINGGFDYQNTGFALRRLVSTETLNLRYSGGWGETHQNLFDDDRGDLLFESRLAPSSQKSKVNDADGNNGVTTLPDTGVAATEYSISSDSTGGSNLAIDLEYLALFPATITDAQADSVRNYINNRNNVFSLIDSQGYYFFDPQIFPIVDPAAFVSYWNGNIVGSDNTLNASVSQSTVNDQPTRDGYKVTFNDNADHLVVASPLSGGQAGWQIVGTSLGTFAYRVNANAVTELNLLGNFGSTFRKTGDLYGIILLPESASSADIESARKLLTDRGASDGDIIGISFSYAWLDRTDIVEFKSIRLSNTINFTSAWHNSTSLSSFGAIDASNGSNFSSAWRGTSALTSFPSGAKLGTEATNVNFTSAWQSSGLTSFPALDLSTGSNFANSFTSSALTSFPAGIKMGTAATGDVQFTDTWRDTTLSSFPALDLGNGKFFNGAWRDCDELTSFPSDIKLGTNKTGLAFPDTWRGSGLASFPALDLSTGAFFNSAWQGCSSLTSFPAGAKLGTSASNVNFSGAWRQSGLTSFSTPLPTADILVASWRDCSSMTSFSVAELPLATDSRQSFLNCDFSTFSTEIPKSKAFQYCWSGCSSLTDFSADVLANWNPVSLYDSVFDETWANCTSLTAQSVENILVSIDASGKYATTNGASGGSALADAGIDIDYNTATGTPAYSTLASLKAKGWSIIVNNVTL